MMQGWGGEEDRGEEDGCAVLSDNSEGERPPGHFPRDHPFLAALRKHLTSRHGRGRLEKEARQISNTVSAYLSFAQKANLNPSHLADALKMSTYLDHLQESGKSATSQHATLCRLKQGLSFHALSLEPADVPRAERCLTLISNWLSALGKEARRAKRDHLEDMSASAGGSSAATMSAIETFSNNQEMVETLQTTVRSVKKGEWVSQVRVRTVMIWLAGCLVHCNAQRPGAITGATLAEYQAAGVSQVGRGKYTTMVVKNHKTSTTGSAKITLGGNLASHLKLFVEHLRPVLEGSSTSLLLFPNREGRQLDHLSRHLHRLAEKLHIQLPKTATETRHAAATAVVERSDNERTAVAAAMSHSKRTQELYYALNKGRKQAVEGYRVMEGMRRGGGGGGTLSSLCFSEGRDRDHYCFLQGLHTVGEPAIHTGLSRVSRPASPSAGRQADP